MNTPNLSPDRSAVDADVVVIGGSFGGATSALLLRRMVPDARIVVVERLERIGKKVGEATVECSAFFLYRVLRLYDYLSREQLPKHGLRYWFHDRPDCTLAEMSEIGALEEPGVPTFQLDRSKLDEHILALAGSEGCEVVRPAKVADVDLGWPKSTVTVELADGTRRQITTRWVIDASGRQGLLGKKLRVRRPVEEHPTAAMWGRFRGVKDLDGPEIIGPDPRQPRLPPLRAARRLATNHFCGYGYWAWAIPLSGGETSIGLVYDRTLFEPPATGSLRERFLDFVTTHPGLRELLDGAELDEADFLALQNIPYRTERYMDRGWALVADAAAFMDPYYSPGLDHASMSVWSTMTVIEQDLNHPADLAKLEAAIAAHNDRFLRSYPRWISALYLGKYELMGDAELTACSFWVDTALYYVGVVNHVYRDPRSLAWPAFGLPIVNTRIAAVFMRFFKGRLLRIARLRRELGTYGRRNAGWRSYGPHLGLEREAWPMLWRGLTTWARLELGHLRARLRHPLRKVDNSRRVVLAGIAPD